MFGMSNYHSLVGEALTHSHLSRVYRIFDGRLPLFVVSRRNKQTNIFFFNLGVDNHLLADSPRFPPPALLVFSAVLSSTRRGSHLKVVSQGPHRVKSCGAFERSWTDVKRKDGRRMEQMEAKQMLHWNQRKTIYI